jgi:hypothetical protein
VAGGAQAAEGQGHSDHADSVRKTAFFLSFPYVCPEPVLVKCSFLYINGAKMPFSAGA